MNSTFYIVSMEMFRIYKLFSISCRNNMRFETPEKARNSIYDLCDKIKPEYDNLYIETLNENKIAIYVDEGIEKHVLHTLFTINVCESISDNETTYAYRDHIISIINDAWVVSLDDGPIMGFESLDASLDFIDYSMVTRDNVVRINGNYMINMPAFNKGKPVS